MPKVPTRTYITIFGSTVALLVAGRTTSAFKTIASTTSPQNNITNNTTTSSPLSRRSFIMTSSTAVLATSAATTPNNKENKNHDKKEDLLKKEETKNNKIWNRFADNYAKQPIADEETYQKKLAMTRKYLTPSSNVLEFGCGTGGTALLHAPYVKHIHAIDVSSRMIEIAKERQQEAAAAAGDGSSGVDNVTFECSGIDSLQVTKTPVDGDESSEFDVVLGLNILHLVPNTVETINKVHSVMKPGGYFISSTACIGDHAKFLKYIAPMGHWLGLLPTLKVFTKAQLRTSMEDAGFQIEEEFHPAVGKGVFLVARKMKQTYHKDEEQEKPPLATLDVGVTLLSSKRPNKENLSTKQQH